MMPMQQDKHWGGYVIHVKMILQKDVFITENMDIRQKFGWDDVVLQEIFM